MLTQTGPSPIWEWDEHSTAPNTVLSYSRFFSLESCCEKKLSLYRGMVLTLQRGSRLWGPMLTRLILEIQVLGCSPLLWGTMVFFEYCSWISGKWCARRFFSSACFKPSKPHVPPNLFLPRVLVRTLLYRRESKLVGICPLLLYSQALFVSSAFGGCMYVLDQNKILCCWKEGLNLIPSPFAKIRVQCV